MAQIDKPNLYFNTKLYTQNASTNAITGVNFQPDFTWIKNRDSGTRDHRIFDSVRGANKPLKVNGTNAEATETDTLNSFDSDGFTLGADTSGYGVNDISGNNTVSWNWLASNTTASNTQGDITSTVSANTTSGFSIVSYTGNGTAGATVGHSLGSVPSLMIVKRRSNTEDWRIYHKTLGATQYLNFNTNAVASATNRWNDTEPTSSVFSIGDHASVNFSGDDFVAYLFAEKKGFSKFGSYTGNGNVDGTFIYLGFKPAFFLLKESSGSDNWTLMDTKRLGYNPRNDHLFPNLSNAEYATDRIDMVSNGIKINNDDPSINQSGSTYIYMAFASEPLVGSNNVPATAR